MSNADPIFKVNGYESNADNRDGHALGVATELIKGVQADHKLLVWVSDGMPSNYSTGLDNVGGKSSYSSPDREVLMDLAKAVKQARKVCPFLPLLINNADHVHEEAATYYGADYVPIKAMAAIGEVTGLEQVPVAVHRFIAKLLRQGQG
jgi:nitric oxide reductase activation protein